eukprot:TRINITY_DN310_c0_g4_i1.p2 TRINITY_DN310_c0_g4~~TRINITY_DN310_c0_g4_i1.p2  ORF type:complete len:682 (-),score=92.23 TRINITY_DN310_c0_g4_i1:14221-16266(-)
MSFELSNKQERRKVQKRNIKEGQYKAHQKLISRILSKEYLKQLKPKTLRALRDEGLFSSTFLADYYSHTVPWMYKETAEILDAEQDYSETLWNLVKEKAEEIVGSHVEVLKKESKRKAEIIAERERKAEEEMKAKEERRKQREERRRLEELKKLHDKVEQEIIKKGVEKEEIIKQEISNIHGFFQGREIAGVIGGLLAEMSVIFTAVGEALPDKDFLTEKNAYIFVVMYLGQWMKQEFFPFFLGPKLVQFLASKDVKLDEIHSMDPSLAKEFAELYKAYEDEDPILKLLRDRAESIGIALTAIDYLRCALLKLLLRKPTDPDPQGRNVAAKGKLRVVTLPEPFDKNPAVSPHAIAKIMIPKPSEDEANQENEEPKRKPVEETKKKQSLNKSKGGHNTNRKVTTRGDMGEPEYDDKVLTVKPLAEDLLVYVIHEAATKEVRMDLHEFVKKQFAKDLESVEPEAIKESVETIGGKMEAEFLEKFKDVPVFTFQLFVTSVHLTYLYIFVQLYVYICSHIIINQLIRLLRKMKQEKGRLFGAAEERAKKEEQSAGLIEGYEEKQRLNQLHAMMHEEVTQMGEINKTMDTISGNLKKTNVKYGDYDVLIGHSGKHVSELTRKYKRLNQIKQGKDRKLVGEYGVPIFSIGGSFRLAKAVPGVFNSWMGTQLRLLAISSGTITNQTIR